MDFLEPVASETADELALPEKQYRVCKISIVNQNGEIILDTLVDYRKKEIKPESVNTAVNAQPAQNNFSDGESDKENQSKQVNKATPSGQKIQSGGLLGRKRRHDQLDDVEKPVVVAQQKQSPPEPSVQWKEVSLSEIHGISVDELDGAPTLDEVN